MASPPVAAGDSTVTSDFPYNPEHAVGTCSKCGKEMVYNVPRMGPDGGFVHKEAGLLQCGCKIPENLFLDQSLLEE